MNLPKWMHIYNSVLRFKFYAYLETQSPEVLKYLDRHFQNFVTQHGLNSNNDAARFFGGDFLTGLCYLILVRTNEYIEKELSPEEQESVWQIENWKIFDITNFEQLQLRYNVTINTLINVDRRGNPFYSNDQEKISFFVRKVRNSLAHHRFETFMVGTDSFIKLSDIYQGVVQMKCIFKYPDFLNFCMDFVQTVNDSLYKINRNENQ